MKIHLTMNGATDTHLHYVREAVAAGGIYHDDYHLIVQTESATTCSGGSRQAELHELADENHRLTRQNESLADALAANEARLAHNDGHIRGLEDQLAACNATIPVPVGHIVNELTPGLIAVLPIGATFTAADFGVLVKVDQHGLAWKDSLNGGNRLAAVSSTYGPFTRINDQDIA